MTEKYKVASWRKGVPPDEVGFWLRKPHAGSPAWIRSSVIDINGNLRLFEAGSEGGGSTPIDHPRLKYSEWWWYGPIPNPPGGE